MKYVSRHDESIKPLEHYNWNCKKMQFIFNTQNNLFSQRQWLFQQFYIWPPIFDNFFRKKLCKFGCSVWGHSKPSNRHNSALSSSPVSLNSIPIQFTEGTDTQQLFSTQFTPAMSQFQFNSDSLTKQLDSTLLDSFLRNWVGIDSRVWINSYRSALQKQSALNRSWKC